MENNSLSNDKKNSPRVSAYSKSIDINATRKLELQAENPQLETVENDFESGLKSKTTENYFLANRPMTTTLYHKVSSVPHTQDTGMNTFCSKSQIVYLSRVNRVLILIKILSSILFFVASPISLIVLIQELIGYLAVRFLRQCIILLYGMSLFITVILRIIVSILLAFDYIVDDTFFIVVLVFLIVFAFIDFTQIYYIFKLYNTTTTLDYNTKTSLLKIMSGTCIPP